MSKAFRTTAGVFSDEQRYTVRVVGPDRGRFLNGMLSNDVTGLKPGQGCWAVKATHKGRIEGLLRVRARSDEMLLDLAGATAERVAGSLSEYIVADDCELVDATPERDVVWLFGPRAPEILGELIDPEVALLGEAAHAMYGDVVVIGERRFAVPGFEIHVPAGRAAAWVDDLTAASAVAVTRSEFDVLRVESRVPEDGPELNLETFPMEARLDYAINYRKGCYIGQEVITRATTQGAVKHILAGMEFEVGATELPPSGSKLYAPGQDKPVGELTSVVQSEHFGRGLGLGFVRRQHEARGTKLIARAGDPQIEYPVAVR